MFHAAFCYQDVWRRELPCQIQCHFRLAQILGCWGAWWPTWRGARSTEISSCSSNIESLCSHIFSNVADVFLDAGHILFKLNFLSGADETVREDDKPRFAKDYCRSAACWSTDQNHVAGRKKSAVLTLTGKTGNGFAGPVHVVFSSLEDAEKILEAMIYIHGGTPYVGPNW